MLNFWLFVGVGLTIFITYKTFTDGFNKWGYYYVFAALALIMYFFRKFMLNRMAKHLEFLENQEKTNSGK